MWYQMTDNGNDLAISSLLRYKVHNGGHSTMKRLRILIALIVALAMGTLDLEYPATSSKSSYTAKVIGIADGDTLVVRRRGRKEKLRLFGVDCPEKRQAFGMDASQFTRLATLDTNVTVVPVGQDRYGRVVAYLLLENGRNFNYLLVSEGCAWWFRRYAPHDFQFAAREILARLKGKGLWLEASPVPPWDFRKSISSKSGREPID